MGNRVIAGRVVSAVAAVVLLMGAGFVALGRPDEDVPVEDVPVDETPPTAPLATARLKDPDLHLEVVAVERLTADVVEVRLTVANPDPVEPLELGVRFAAAPGEAGTFSGSFLTTSDGSARYFVLRHADGRPACSEHRGALAPGERRAAWIRFGGPGRAATRITLQIKGLPPLTGLPLTDAP